MEQIRLNMYDQAIKSVANLEYLVARLGLYVAGSPEEIKAQLEKHLADEAVRGAIVPEHLGLNLHMVKNP